MRRIDVPATDSEPAKVRFEGNRSRIERLVGAVGLFGLATQRMQLLGAPTTYEHQQLMALGRAMSASSYPLPGGRDYEGGIEVSVDDAGIVVTAVKYAVTVMELDMQEAALRQAGRNIDLDPSSYRFEDIVIDPMRSVLRDILPAPASDGAE